VAGAGRHLTVHLGGSLAAVALGGGVPALAVAVLGGRATLLLVVVAALVLAPVVATATFVWKVMRWLRAPVPFRIPLTVGQQKSLTSLPHDRVGNPFTLGQVLARAALDILLLRPLFRATPSAPSVGRGLGHGMGRTLWLFAAVFHASLLAIVLRHLRLFLEPAPAFVAVLERADVVTEMVLPKVHLTTLLFPLALALLLGRRLLLPRLRYLSLAADYFPLLLLLAIAGTGIVMRHFARTDVTAVKELTLGLAGFSLVLPAQADPWLVMHLGLVGLLVVYFPLGKLMHMPGVLLSPTLTLANVNRHARHINVRNPQVETMHYEDYENAFRERMIEAGLPVEQAVTEQESHGGAA
jgi:nitrate reductase gamma subunit